MKEYKWLVGDGCKLVPMRKAKEPKNEKKPLAMIAKMDKKLKIAWGSDFWDEASGNAYGYKVHNATLKKYVGKIAELDQDAKDVVIIAPPDIYGRAIPDKVNWLFTMFEGTTLNERYVKSMQKADFFLTPSTWVKELFDKYFDPEKVFVVSHGVEEDFTFKKRYYPNNRPFRYLWVGAPNPRKGWEEIIHTWDSVFKNIPGVELYIKTTLVEGLQRNGNVILDGRDLTRAELIRLYHDAHCFLFPSRGEGFGLTLAEAMRTGLPCIGTDYSGQTDFFDDEVGYTIGYKMGDGWIKFIGDGKKYKTQIAFPLVDELVKHMVYIKTNYKEALKKGINASYRIKTKFTWEESARTLIKIIGEHGEENASITG